MQAMENIDSIDDCCIWKGFGATFCLETNVSCILSKNKKIWLKKEENETGMC